MKRLSGIDLDLAVIDLGYKVKEHPDFCKLIGMSKRHVLLLLAVVVGCSGGGCCCCFSVAVLSPCCRVLAVFFLPVVAASFPCCRCRRFSLFLLPSFLAVVDRCRRFSLLNSFSFPVISRW